MLLRLWTLFLPLIGNLKGIQNSLKRLRLFEYLKHFRWVLRYIFKKLILPIKLKKVKGQLWRGAVFLTQKINSCGFVIHYIGTKSVKVLQTRNNENIWFVILEAINDNYIFILINLDCPNTKIGHVFALVKCIK